jgi:hypothetical protein
MIPYTSRGTLRSGWKHTDAAKRQIGLASRRRKRSRLTRQRLSQSIKRKWKDPVHRAKHRQPNRRTNYTGRRTTGRYVFLHHPLRGAVQEHRFVIEQRIGRQLLTKEEVHHLGDKHDNRPHMLMAFTSKSAHQRFECGSPVSAEEILFDGRTLPH